MGRLVSDKCSSCGSCTGVGRILRTFKIKKNVEVTDNGKIII
ncbi:helicase [Agathobacter rectalis]|uniref:Helicase n=1 Tax=Agathobacter rectalis TaxID=39491 RepID=A0A413ZY48_9FIRM|nr:helicase [Agathobacter rectalis]RGS01937.1 helicase [Agathobacter rectalis]RHC36945.1 helicase [Agathobacter rectalis]